MLLMGSFPSLVPHCPLICAKELPNKTVSAFEIKLLVYGCESVELLESPGAVLAGHICSVLVKTAPGLDGTEGAGWGCSSWC